MVVRVVAYGKYSLKSLKKGKKRKKGDGGRTETQTSQREKNVEWAAF